MNSQNYCHFLQTSTPNLFSFLLSSFFFPIFALLLLYCFQPLLFCSGFLFILFWSKGSWLTLCSSGAVGCSRADRPQLTAISLTESLYREAGVSLLSCLCVSRESTPSVDSLFLFDCVFGFSVCWKGLLFFYFKPCGGSSDSHSLHFH